MRDFFEIAVLEPMRRLYEQLVQFVPKLLGLFVLSFLGLFLGWVASHCPTQPRGRKF
jgi:flagellar biosynthesis protein FliQ